MRKIVSMTKLRSATSKIIKGRRRVWGFKASRGLWMVVASNPSLAKTIQFLAGSQISMNQMFWYFAKICFSFSWSQFAICNFIFHEAEDGLKVKLLIILTQIAHPAFFIVWRHRKIFLLTLIYKEIFYQAFNFVNHSWPIGGWQFIWKDKCQYFWVAQELDFYFATQTTDFRFHKFPFPVESAQIRMSFPSQIHFQAPAQISFCVQAEIQH